MNNVSVSGRQKFLDELPDGKQKSIDIQTIRCLNWNIRNPSLQRATKQMAWLEKNRFDIIALTEVRLSEGGVYIKDRFMSQGYAVIFAKPENEDYGVILAVRRFFEGIPKICIDFLPYRVSFAICHISGEAVLVTGIYAPVWKTEKKRKFVEAFERFMERKDWRNRFSGWIILGDLNVLEPNHIPHYPVYEGWENFYNVFIKQGLVDAFRFFHPEEREYSWFGRKGNGYRFDHIFVSENILSSVKKCCYIHEARLKKLSDHSAMYLEIDSSALAESDMGNIKLSESAGKSKK